MAMNFGSYIASPNNGGMPLMNFGGQNQTPIHMRYLWLRKE